MQGEKLLVDQGTLSSQLNALYLDASRNTKGNAVTA